MAVRQDLAEGGAIDRRHGGYCATRRALSSRQRRNAPGRQALRRACDWTAGDKAGYFSGL